MWAMPQRGMIRSPSPRNRARAPPARRRRDRVLRPRRLPRAAASGSGPSAGPGGGRWRSPSARRTKCRSPPSGAGTRRKTYCDRQSSFLFFNPYFFRSSFSALMRSASHGCDGRSNFARENFGSPNDSLLLLRRLLLFLLLFFLGGGFLRLLRLRGLEGGLLRHPDRQTRAAVRPRALPADLLARLMAHALVRPDHLHQVDIVPQADFDLRSDQVQVEPRLPILRAVHHPRREQLAEVAKCRLNLVRLLLRQVAEPLRPGDAREVSDRLGHPDPHAGDRGEGGPPGSRAVQVRVRHADDVAEVLFHAFELLRRPRRLRLLFLLVLLLRRPARLLRRRRGGRAFFFGCGFLVWHSVP